MNAYSGMKLCRSVHWMFTGRPRKVMELQSYARKPPFNDFLLPFNLSESVIDKWWIDCHFISNCNKFTMAEWRPSSVYSKKAQMFTVLKNRLLVFQSGIRKSLLLLTHWTVGKSQTWQEISFVCFLYILFCIF